ncbi:MAG: FAD-binding oxidoreductase [Chloroflexi bacterium]|nr:FAD-binding oxidoreductase [Chloroflexota bacterium]
MLRDQDKSSLLALFAPVQVMTDLAELVTYETDAGIGRGLPDAVVFANSEEELVKLARWSSERHISLVARGAGTSLSGGPIAEQGGIVVEFAQMNRIVELDVKGKSAVVEPGLLNLKLDDSVRKFGLYFPPDPSSQRASTIGGNVAENAGGAHCFKYGVTTNYVLGLRLVLASGECIQFGGRAFDYPEFDLMGLVVGSEGTLGLITSIDVRLIGNPPAVKTMMAAFDSVEQAGGAVSALIAAGLMPATMEMMDQKFVRIAEDFAHAGLPIDAGAILIIEVDGYPSSLNRQIEEIVEVLRPNGARDMRFANTAEERDKIWYARKSVPGAVSRLAPSYYLVDITVPRSRLAHTLERTDEICQNLGLRVGYLLHAGDGNLHPMILIERLEDPVHLDAVHKAAAEIVHVGMEERGSLTGEHGIGNEKREFMPLMFNPAELSAMWDVKQIFDPDGLLNPGKVFPFAPSVPARTIDLQIPENDVLAPRSPTEAADLLAGLSAAKRRVRIGYKPVPSGETLLSTSALAQVIEYAPDDLFITVGGGMRVSDLQAFLARDHRWVPIVSAWPEATVGGILASNVNAPLRMRYGSVRDVVLAMTVALADGRLIRAGRPVIKNVAGYDLQKVFVGSHGALGLIADATLRLLPEPRARRTLLVELSSASAGLDLAMQAATQSLVASAIILRRGSFGRCELTYTAEGVSLDVEAELEQARRVMQSRGMGEPRVVEQPSGSDRWAAALGNVDPQMLLVRVGVPPKDLATYFEDVKVTLSDSWFLMDAAGGLVYAAANPGDLSAARSWLEALEEPTLALGGYSTVMQIPERWDGKLEMRRAKPQSFALMRALKAKWDPAHILVSHFFDV